MTDEKILDKTSRGTLVLTAQGGHMVRMTREQWKKTHRDFKGSKNGQKTTTWLIPGSGTCLIPVEIVKEEK